MARIRSIHPGLFTDGDFATMDPLALILFLGILTEADDQGVFKWSPREFKVRILPGHSADVDALLAILVEADRIRSFESDGRRYGAIRNFQTWQRPKKPNPVHALPETLREYVGVRNQPDEKTASEPASGEAVGNQSPTGGEKPPQKEEGGRRGEEEGEGVISPVVPSSDASPSAQPKQARATRLPREWSLPPPWADHALLHHPLLNVEREAQRFADYWHAKSGSGATKHDWFATWRNWLKQAEDRLPASQRTANGPQRHRSADTRNWPDAERRSVMLDAYHDLVGQRDGRDFDA